MKWNLFIFPSGFHDDQFELKTKFSFVFFWVIKRSLIGLIFKIKSDVGKHQGADTSCMCVCTKRVCVKFTEPKACTVGIYSTYESRYLYSLGEYKNKFNIDVKYYLLIYLSQQEYILIEVYNYYSLFKLNYNWHCSTRTFLDCSHVVCLYQKSVRV